MKEKQFNYYINVGYVKNNELKENHLNEGDKIIYQDDEKTGLIRIYQYYTRCFVGLINNDKFEKCIEY